jgi:hypothetical protein
VLAACFSVRKRDDALFLGHVELAMTNEVEDVPRTAAPHDTLQVSPSLPLQPGQLYQPVISQLLDSFVHQLFFALYVQLGSRPRGLATIPRILNGGAVVLAGCLVAGEVHHVDLTHPDPGLLAPDAHERHLGAVGRKGGMECPGEFGGGCGMKQIDPPLLLYP